VITVFKLFYETDEPQVINEAFEKNLGHFLAQYGLERYGSGYDLDTEVRDIAFDQLGRRLYK